MGRDMDDDDPGTRRQTAALRNLDPLSVKELNDYICDLEAEISRARAAIASKQSVRSGAESLFKK